MSQLRTRAVREFIAALMQPREGRNLASRPAALRRNHLDQTWACDWFTIVTLRFQILHAFVILVRGCREVLRLGVTPSPSAQHAAQSLVEAVPS